MIKLDSDLLRNIASDAHVSFHDLRKLVNNEGRSLVNAIAACKTISAAKIIDARERERAKFSAKIKRTKARR